MKLDEGACTFGAGVLLRHIDALASASVGVQQGEQDIEFVHAARVASRRLRTAIPLFKNCLPSKKTKKWLRGIRKVTRALGDARDTDVQLEWLQKFQNALPDKRYQPGIQRLMLRLRQNRAKLQKSLSAAMEHLAGSHLLADMAAELQPSASRAEETYVFTPTLYQHSFQAIHSRLETLLAYDAVVDHPDQAAELHEMRIAAKWLRYSMETFAPLYAEQLKTYLQVVRATQDLLGEIHDCDVWQLSLPRFLEEERQRTLAYYGQEGPLKRLVVGIQYLGQERLQERARLYEQFRSNWHTWQAAGLWNELRRTIQVPFLQPSQIYPPLIMPPEDNPTP